MAHDVFISYSARDKAVADAVCATLESKKIRCWIAPRDVLPGEKWVAALIDAIGQSRAFVLVFSEGANRSPQVLNEVGEAVDRGIPIIPFRIEDVPPSKEIGYYIKAIHWLDALGSPLEVHLNKLADTVQALIPARDVAETEVTPPAPVAAEKVSPGHVAAKWDVFISHVEEDGVIVLEVAQGLEAAGYTTWYYERDALPGVSYLAQVRQAIEQSQAVVVIISSHSLSSQQVAKEVMAGQEGEKPLIPVLRGITRLEFQKTQQGWPEAVAAATSISIPVEGTAAILPRVIHGLNALGIQPTGKAVPPREEEKARVSPETAPRKFPLRIMWVVVLLVLAVLAGRVWIWPLLRPPVKLKTKVLEPSGITMVYVPAGEFLMGSADSDPKADDEEKPQHTVYLDGYWIGQTEVTNAQFAKFIAAGGYSKPEYWTDNGWWWKESQGITQPFYWTDVQWNNPDYPVVAVSWYEAAAYAKWAGVRLPTEAEWEKAARGTDGRTYPWGNSWDTTRLNFCDRNCTVEWKDSTADDGYGTTAPVGSYASGVSPYGVLDMAGNVWEWVADWYSASYYSQSPASNPGGPTWGTGRVVRGGCWDSDRGRTRCAYRQGIGPDYNDIYCGFRVAE
jgi:formylglycine-generating enzyme required for sulfatase activity